MEMVTLNVDISTASAKKCAKLAGIDFSEWQDGGNGGAEMNKIARKFLVEGLKCSEPKTKKKKRS